MREQHERFRSKSLVEDGRDAVAVVPSAQAAARDVLLTIAGALLFLCTGALLLLSFLPKSSPLSMPGDWFTRTIFAVGCLVGGVMGPAGILSYRARGRVRFDRAAGTLTERRGGITQTRPLGDVERISLGKGGPHEEQVPGFLGGYSIVRYETAIVTAHLQDGRHLVLSNHTDLDWSVQAANRIAAFLHVPGPEHQPSPPSRPAATADEPPDPTRCPACGFKHKWNGGRCGHCGHVAH